MFYLVVNNIKVNWSWFQKQTVILVYHFKAFLKNTLYQTSLNLKNSRQ
ncbi:hypothetical protein P278_12000 [Zhouia amylolytica AD3]|uniref:Uncharacterized protein n=1 Tax=Zhouia amylolytica AD3 TaxID=1286632 RepID=W2UN95_9FLAO|nr:hypothetical protein P278_12000 [Zhouia amylolytica AD3]